MNRAAGNTDRADLAAVLGEVSGMEAALTLALRRGGSLGGMDLTAAARLIQTSRTTLGAADAAHTAAAGTAAAGLAAATTATRQEVGALSHDLFERRIFDPYLRFVSGGDEADYRTREAERQRQIADQLARGTAEGALNAGGLAAGQMLDAHAHGAGASPEFLPRWNRLVEQLHQQREALRTAGKSTEAFDRQLREDIRAALQREGLSAKQIAQVLAADDPLRAVTPHLADQSARDLEIRLGRQSAPPATPPTSIPAILPQAPNADDDALLAAGQYMLAAGVRQEGISPPGGGHGLSDQPRVVAITTVSDGRT